MAYKDPEKAKEYYKQYNFKRKGKQKEYYKQYYVSNKERINKRNNKWYSNNKEEKLKKNKQWNSDNRDKIRKYEKQKRDTNPSYKLLINLRSRTRLALKGKCKSANTRVLLGVTDIEFLWKHLEKSFKPGMTRENHGKVWHIDHIIPCVSFDLTDPEQQKKCFHYSNLQALFVHENLSKGAKILSPDAPV
jgi:hypothetical protein